MPVKIGTFGPLSEAEFTELRQQKARKTDPAMAALKERLKTAFLAANPRTDEAEFIRLWPRLHPAAWVPMTAGLPLSAVPKMPVEDHRP
jgi:hypothetical protein